MRVINLSVDGIVQAAQRGLYDWLMEQEADVICLQDIRALEYELDADQYHPPGYFSYFFDSGIQGYNGVAIYCKQQPKALIYGFGFSDGTDMEGRYLQADFERISIGSLMAPSARLDTQSPDVKLAFFDQLQAHLHKITRKRREFIFCGNWEMAHHAMDVSNPELMGDQCGFLPHERQWMEQLYTQIGYSDAFRRVNQDADEYTWHPSDPEHDGEAWRTDLQVISDRLDRSVEYGVIYKKRAFSSHRPVIMDYDIEL